MKQIGKIITFLLVFVSTKVFSQNISLSTGHQSISMEVKDMGYTADIFTTNEHVSDVYDVSYTVEFTLKCGGTKIYSNKISIGAGKTDHCGGYTIAIPEVKGCDRGVQSARLTSFSAKAQQKETSSATASSMSSSTSTATATTLSRPADNASLAEKAAWQRQQYGTQTANTQQTTQNTQRLNNLNNLQNQQAQQQKTQQQEQGRSEYNAVMQRLEQSTKNNNETIANSITNIANLLGRTEQDDAYDRRKEQQRRNNEQFAAEQRAETAKKQAIINNRKAVIAEFPEKEIPLGSQEKAENIYYFVYAYDNTINNEYGATVYVSNVFEIGKYSDGTRAYTSTVHNEIGSLTPYAEALHGYYYTQQEAEQLRQTLISILKNNGVAINEVTYKGKPATVKNAGTQNTAPGVPPSKYGKTISIDGAKNDQNLAPAKINTAKPSELPRETQKKEESKYGKTIKID